jgi:lipid-binding SYLF domain-containing protein
MKRSLNVFLAMAALVCASALADDFDDTTAVFKNAGQSAGFFSNSYGYAVFPNIAKGGLGVGAAHGKGRVYQAGKYVGDTSMTQVSIGLQAGGQAYSQIIFMEDQRSFDEFTSGNFGFDATVGAVAITASAGANASTQGGGTSTSAGKNDATTKGKYHKGMAVFTVVKGGAMYEASVAGQKFSYKAK